MQNERYGKNPGALGLGQSTATALSYFFQFWCYVTPIFGAIVADTWLGRYKAICLFAGVYICGLLIIFITSLPFALDNGAGLGGLIACMIVLGLGTGGIKSNVSPLIAEQYTETTMRIKTLPSGERVILDPAVTMQSIFNIFYWCINFGSLSAIATTWMELKIDFWAAYLLPFCFFFIAIVVLVIGKNSYVVRPPKGSVLVEAGKALWIGIKNKGNLDAAKPSVSGLNVPWNDVFVDELRRGLVACRVFLFYPIYWLVYGQMVSNFVSMAGTMETHGLPNDLLFNLNPITIIIFLPFIEKYLYPTLRRMGIPFRPVSRIACGFGFAALSMVYAAVLQHYIYKAGPCYDHPLTGACSADANGDEGMVPQHIHVALQTPAYVLVGLSEIFASVTGLEYAFTKAPPSMKSLVTSLFLVTNAVGAALGIALSPTSEHPKLVIMFASIAGATAIAGSLFWLLFKKYNEQEVEMNQLELEDDNKPVPLKEVETLTKQSSRV